MSPLHNTRINQEVAVPIRSKIRPHHRSQCCVSWLSCAARGGRHSSRACDIIEFSRCSDWLAHPNLSLPDVFLMMAAMSGAD